MRWSRQYSSGLAYYYRANNKVDKKALRLVFIHGVGLRAESWYRQLSVFETQYHCYAIDMPGHGDSEMLPNSSLVLDDFSEVLNTFIDEVVGQPTVIVGHSLGAMTALQTAISYPKVVRGVAALNAIYERPTRAAQQVQARAESLLTDLKQDVSDRPIARWFEGESQYDDEAQLCRTWLDEGNRLGYARAYQMFADLVGIKAAALQAIKAPTLFLTGELDINSKAEMSLAMAQILPNAKAVIIPKARHMAQMTHSDVVNTALANFFTQLDAYNMVDA